MRLDGLGDGRSGERMDERGGESGEEEDAEEKGRKGASIYLSRRRTALVDGSVVQSNNS